MDREIEVIVRVLPNGDELDVSLPLNATATDVIETLLDSGSGIPRVDPQGNHYSYSLVVKGQGTKLEGHETLGHARIYDGDVLLLTPHLVAGQ